MALFLDVSLDDVLRIGATTITVERKSGRKTRLRIDGPDDVKMTKKPDPAEREKADHDGPHS